MDIKFNPPVLTGTDREKLQTLEKWLAQFCEKLNVAFQIIQEEVKK